MRSTKSEVLIPSNRLLPIHLAGEVIEGEKSAKIMYRERRLALKKAPDLDKLLRKYVKKQYNQDPPENKNLALMGIEEFRSLAKEAQSVRRIMKRLEDPEEECKLHKRLTALQTRLKEWLSLGDSFEHAYRVYLEYKVKYFKFVSLLHEMKSLRSERLRSRIRSLPKDAAISDEDRSRVEHVLHRDQIEELRDVAAELKTLECVYPKDSDKYKKLRAMLKDKERKRLKSADPKKSSASVPLTVSEAQERLDILEAHAKDLWQEDMVRYFWGRRENEKMLADIAAGKSVLENPEVVKYLNCLREWETVHFRTTVGGVLVGPPGVGKTTLVRHYLERTGRKYNYIDLSEDVTRYLLYGSKEMRFTNNSEYLKRLCQDITNFDDKALKSFISEHSERLCHTAKVSEDEALLLALDQLKCELDRTDAEVEPELVEAARERLSEFAGRAYRREVNSEFGHLVSRNGWRDGVVIAALRENRCLIFDEFPHFKQWHMLNSLMTASPGQSWYFADNDEWIDIPKNWRMYFTGNIGSRHGGYSTAEKMASRVAGMVLEVDYPSKRTELTTALALICDRDGNILLDKNDQAKLFVLVNDVFPKLRALITNEKHTVPLSYRTLQNLAEKLVQRHDPETGAPTPRARGTKSFDQALLEEVLDSYALWDNRKIKGNIVDIMTSVGLLLDDSVKERVLPYINPQIYEERKEIFSKMKGDFDKVTAALRGYADGAQISANTLPQVF